jgi:ribosomal protein S27E
MPVVIACSACQGKLSIPDRLTGKSVKCPKCGETIRPSGGEGAATAPAPAAVKVQAAPKPQAPAAPAASAAAAPPAAPPVLVTCAGCQKKLQVRAALAGKAVKCPGCGQAIPVPAPAAEDGEGWLDVNEAAAPPPAPAAAPEEKAGRGPSGDWGQGVLTGQGVPEDMQDEIRSEMTRTERVVWATRPRQDILLHQARMFAYIGGPICCVVALGAAVAAVLCGIHGVIWGLAIALVFGGMFGFGAFFVLRMPGSVIKNASRRGCYLLTNRRLLVHHGKGPRVFFGRGGAAAVSDVSALAGVVPYTGLELTGLTRVEAGKRFEGAGDLSAGRTLLDEAGGCTLQAVDKVRDVEKLIRAKLIHPVIDKLLRGELLLKDELARSRGKRPEKKTAPGEADEGAIATDSNIKDYGGGRHAAEEDDPNIKAAPSTRTGGRDLRAFFEAELKRVPAEARQTVADELTEGEKILWIGRPEASAKGRGFLGAMVGSDRLVEPKYWLYAITNRRVILFVEKSGPVSYYTPDVLEAGVEDDTRIVNGGSILFKKVRRIVTTRDNKGKTSTTRYLHSFGLLRIRHYKAVASLLYDTLIAPVRGR